MSTLSTVSDLNLESIFNHISESVLLTDAEGIIISFNNNTKENVFNNIDKELKTGESIFSYVEDSRRDFFKEKVNSVLNGNSVQYDNEFERRSGEKAWFQLSINPVYDDNKISGLCIVGRDITENKIAGENLKKSEAGYRYLFANNPLPLWIYDMDTFQFLEVNKAAVWLYGYSREEFLSMTLHDIRSKDAFEELERVVKEVKINNAFSSGTWQHHKKSGELMYVEISGMSMSYHHKNARLILINDITQKKLAGERLLKSESRLANAQSVAKVGSWETDLSDLKVIWSEETFRIFEIEPENFKSSHPDFLQFVHPEDRAKVDEEFVASLDKDIVNCIEHRIITPKGSEKVVEERWRILRNAAGKPERAVGTCQDITLRKKIEAKIIESEQRYRTLFEQNLAGFYQSTLNGQILNCNDAFAKMLKYDSAKDLLNINASELYFSSSDRNEFISNVLDQQHLYNYEGVLKAKDGSALYFLENISVKKDIVTGEDFFDGILIDITERKQAELELREINERYNFLSKATHDMVWDWNLTSGEVFRNSEGWKKIFRTTKGEEIGTREEWNKKIFIDDQPKVQHTIDEAIKSDSLNLFEAEFRILRDDNTIGCIEDRGYIIRNQQGKAIRIIGASHDITERKNAEQKVLLSEQRFKSLVQNSSDLLAILDMDGIYTYVSPTSKSILGYDPEFFYGKSPFSFMHQDDVQKAKDSLAKVATEKFIKVPLFRFKNEAGEWRWIESTITNMMDNPAIEGIVVNSRDITEKKIADDEIEKLSLIAKETVNGIMIRDMEQNIIWINAAFTKMYGYELSEVKGKKPGSFLHGPETDVEINKQINEHVKENKPFAFEIIHYTKSGCKRNVRVQSQPVFNDEGEIKQYFAMLTDITKEKELETRVELEQLIKQKEITEAVIAAQENERSEIGREMHDNVNQLLGATRLYIDTARKNEQKRDALLNSASGFALSAIEEIRKLSKTLITPLINDIGLQDSIKDTVQEIMHVHPVKIAFTSSGFMEDELNDKFKLNIFRIVQEQINNTLKHAHAKNISINIEGANGKILVNISDDGVGFDTTKRKAGVGITNIKSRIELYNGTMLLNSEPGKGTTLAISFNKTDLVKTNLENE